MSREASGLNRGEGMMKKAEQKLQGALEVRVCGRGGRGAWRDVGCWAACLLKDKGRASHISIQK